MFIPHPIIRSLLKSEAKLLHELQQIWPERVFLTSDTQIIFQSLTRVTIRKFIKSCRGLAVNSCKVLTCRHWFDKFVLLFIHYLNVSSSSTYIIHPTSIDSMTKISMTNKNIFILTTALIAKAACSTVDATTATLLRGGGLRQQQQQQQQHVVVLEEEEDGIDEVGEQVQHYPPPNWDGLSTPSRRELMRNRALDASLQQHLVDESEDPNPDIAVMGRLIEDENDTGLFDWEMIVDATATTVEEKVYDPPVDAITVSLYIMNE